MYSCPFCGYVYKPSEGDPLNNIPRNTSFANLLDSWTCPGCYVRKEAFKERKNEVPKFGIQNKRIDEEERNFAFPDKKMKKAG
ncbi:MAG: rubredoxin [Candidatus Riflebacteria bacterium]|nr:rubredoxin [Candidatus Riflebacteria bacterium]